jgi:hypothetical protein
VASARTVEYAHVRNASSSRTDEARAGHEPSPDTNRVWYTIPG